MRAKLIQKTWMGMNIVAWCDENGRVCVAEAYCPHPGSYLGPPRVGADAMAGSYVPSMALSSILPASASPLPIPPHRRYARLGVFETREVLGLIFAWWGIQGRASQWSLPADPPDQADWSGIEIRTNRFPGHPQETTENSVDWATCATSTATAAWTASSQCRWTGPVSRAASTSGAPAR